MREPCDTLASRAKTGVAFVGPAQCGKTESLILGWLAYGIKVDPMDMIIYSPTQSASRDFSMRRIDRLHRNSPEIGEILLRNRDSDNKFDKHYRNGMMLQLSHPTVTEFAGKPVGRIALTDYDRMPDDVEGDGNPYDLGSKRTTTFKSFAMTLAESSPSRPVENPKWIRTSPHEAPPCKGILGLYNRGDRRRWYWPCPHCNVYFEGKWSQIVWDARETVLASAETARLACPNPDCGKDIQQVQRGKMQEWGVWLKDGQSIDADGRTIGKGIRSKLASFWLTGVAAAFTTWTNLVTTFLNAMESYEKTGSEEELKKFFNTDLAEPYLPKSADLQRLPEILKSRAERLPYEVIEEMERIDRLTTLHVAIQPHVPDDVRFLVACVDVQQNMFVVQIHGILPGRPFDVVVIDRFSIKKSRRLDAQGETLWVKPPTYLDDWDEITEEVIKRSYPLSDGSGRRMTIKQTVCDSGGKAGTTTNAYNFYRRLKLAGMAGRFQLVKGDPLPSRPRAMIVMPDSNRKDRLAGARGDIPVMFFNSNVLKDSLVSRLESVKTGGGMFRFPDWLPDWWFAEMCVETRGEKGWEAPNHRRNEAWDLGYYCLGVCVSVLLQAETIEWDNPPGWAAPWDKNSLIINGESKEAFAISEDVVYDFAAFGRVLA